MERNANFYWKRVPSRTFTAREKSTYGFQVQRTALSRANAAVDFKF